MDYSITARQIVDLLGGKKYKIAGALHDQASFWPGR